MKPLVFLAIDDVVAIDPNYAGCAVTAKLKSKRKIEDEFWCRVFLSSAVSNLSLLHENFFRRMSLVLVGQIISTEIKWHLLLIPQGLVSLQRILIANEER